jgi:hypothetical protein
MPLPPENPQEVIEFYSNILVQSGITRKVKNVTVTKSLLGGDGSGDGVDMELNKNKEFVTIEWDVQEKCDEEEGKGEEQKKNDEPLLDLFLKKRPSNPEEGILFDKEVFFYSVFLPDALAFTEQRDEFK